MQKFKILVTGANGFIGKSLSEYLCNKFEVFAKSRTELNLLDEKAVESFINENKINYIIHCANVGGSRKYARESNLDIVLQNLKMFFNLERCLTPDRKMIYFGSGAEYDKSKPLIKVKEEEFGEIVPKDDYGYSKYLMTKYAKRSKNIINLRLFGLYGKYEDYRFRFISNAVIKNILKVDIVINQNVFFDYLFIDDFLSIVEKVILEQPSESILNVTPTEKIDLVSISEIINEVSDYKSKIILRNSGFNNEYTGSNSLILKELNGFNFSSYRKGIEELYKYFAKNISNIEIEEIKNDKYINLCSTV